MLLCLFFKETAPWVSVYYFCWDIGLWVLDIGLLLGLAKCVKLNADLSLSKFHEDAAPLLLVFNLLTFTLRKCACCFLALLLIQHLYSHRDFRLISLAKLVIVLLIFLILFFLRQRNVLDLDLIGGVFQGQLHQFSHEPGVCLWRFHLPGHFVSALLHRDLQGG